MKKVDNFDVLNWLPISKRKKVEPSGVSIGSALHIGRRKYQQDSIKASEVAPNSKSKEPIIAILSDGMGGMADGSRASEICTSKIYDDFYRSGIKEGNYPEFIQKEIFKLDQEISQFTDENGKAIRSGATLITCIIDNGNLYYGSVGDSHLYIIRGQEITQVNEDHNYMYELKQKVARGLMTEAQALANPDKDSLISFMGKGNVTLMNINKKPFQMQPGDMVVMCSDGVYRTIDDETIKELANMYNGNVQNLSEKIISVVIGRNNPSQDNISVIILKYL